MNPSASKPVGLHRKLYVQVLVALVAGVAIGHLWPGVGVSLKPLADGFIKLVRMMIAPVVFCTIVIGIAGMKDTKEIGKTLLKSMGLFYVLVTLALLTGLVVVGLMRPGVGMNIDASRLDATLVSQYARQAPVGFVDFLLHIIPQSYVGAFADGDVLPVLLLAILTGWALTRIGAAGDPVRLVVGSFLHVVFAAFGFIIKLSPIGALGAMAFTVGQYGISALTALAMLVVTFFAACIVYVAVVLGALAGFYQFSVWKLIRYFREELLIIFGTSTSDPVLPRLLLKLERLGCEKAIVGLVLPMSYSFNLTGIAIFLTVASMFIAQACNVHLSAGQIATMLVVMLLTSKGATGVAGSGFVVLVATLSVIPDIPLAGVALIVGVDRFMSEMRAITSTLGNAVATIVIAKWEHSCDHATLTRELDEGYLATRQQLDEGALVDASLSESNMSTRNTHEAPELGREYPPPDEQRHIDSLIRQLRAKMERDYAGRRVLRDAHPKMHGCVRGQFSIEPNLPEELRVGIFGQHRTFPAWARFSNASGSVEPDSKRDIRGAAIKLMNVAGPTLQSGRPDDTTHDLILISEDRFLTKDVAQFDGLVAALTGGPIKMLLFFLSHPRAAWNLLVSMKRFGDPLEIRYFSAVPYMLGSRAVKYSLTPHDAVNAPVPSNPSPDYLRERMVERLAGHVATFDFSVQMQVDPVAMPIEDPGVRWDEGRSPFRKVATLTIPSQVFDTPERREFGDNLSFNPWRCLPEHRPLGGISRARRQVYQALSAFRHEHNGAPRVEPTVDDPEWTRASV